MENNKAITGILMDENTSMISFTQVCQTYRIPEDVLTELLEHGLFNEMLSPISQVMFNPPMLKRIQSACRLQNDLGVNLPGVVLVLELRDELERMRNELSILRHHVGEI